MNLLLWVGRAMHKTDALMDTIFGSLDGTTMTMVEKSQHRRSPNFQSSLPWLRL